MNQTQPRRTLRHNLDAEASILGGIILRNEVLADLDTLETEAFYDHRHKVVFEAIRNLAAEDKPIDVITLECEIERQGKLEAVGGIAYLGELTLRVPTADKVAAYASIVDELYSTRKLALVAADVLERCYDGNFEANELLETAMTEISRLGTGRPKAGDLVAIGDLAKKRLAELADVLDRRSRGETDVLTGLPTGIGALDRKIGGWQFGVVNLLAARPAMGKSAVAMASADACSQAELGVHVFSLEDSWRTYVDRSLARHSGVSAVSIRQADLDAKQEGQSDFGKVVHAVANLSSRRTWEIDDRKGLSASEIIRSVRRHKKRLKTRLVVIDYVHLVRRNPMLKEPQAIDEIITAFAAAVEPDEAWLVLSQLNRGLEERDDKRPTQSDLRGSGALEERSKVIIGLYRGSVYGGTPQRDVDYVCPPDAQCAAHTCYHAPSAAEWESSLQAIVLKHSNGAAPVRVFANWSGPTLEAW